MRGGEEHEPDENHGADQDEQQPVGRVPGDAEIERPLEAVRIGDAVLVRPPDHLREIAEDEDHRERQEQLHQVLLVVDVPEKPPLDDDGQNRKARPRRGHAGPETQSERLRHRVEDVGAEHVERAVGEIDDPQHTENERKPRGDDEQVHPLRDGVEYLDERERRLIEEGRETGVSDLLSHEPDQCFHYRGSLPGIKIKNSSTSKPAPARPVAGRRRGLRPLTRPASPRSWPGCR